MADLNAILRISAQDDTAKALAAIKEKIAGIEKSAVQLDKFVSAVGKTTRATDPLAASLLATQKALATQKSEISDVVAGLDRLTGPTDRAAAAQRNLSRQVEVATGALVRQGEAAARANRAVHSSSSPPRAAGHGGDPFHRESVLPLTGPTILAGTREMIMAGATVEEEIARLRAAGAAPADIDRARAEYRTFSRTYSGVQESDYLAGYRDARVISPGEPFEMAALAARYRAGLRNSGVESSECDVKNVLSAMDEVGLKTNAEREHWLNNLLQMQQSFGSQIQTETLLAAYRIAKGSLFGWSPKFRDDYFPTILQSLGQRGGTEISTAFSNWVGGHMQHSELKALVAAGFVDPNDVMYNKTGDAKGLRPGAHPYKSDLFKQDIAEWSWDFHRNYMSRKGATEGGFDDLVAKLPQSFGALVGFLVHNEDRIRRDVETKGRASGFSASSDDFLRNNPIAGLDALQKAITQFASAVSEPAMGALGANLQATAHGLQLLAAAYGDFAKDHPDLAKALGLTAGAAGAGAGGYLTWQLLSGFSKFFGFGGGAAGAAGGAGADAAGVGLTLGGLIPGTAMIMPLAAGGAAAGPLIGIPYWLSGYHDPGVSDFDLERSRRSRLVYHPNGWVDDPEAARARALSGLTDGGHTVQVDTNVRGEATFNIGIRVEAGSELLRIVQQAFDIRQSVELNPLQGGHSGQMNTDAAPLPRGMPGRY